MEPDAFAVDSDAELLSEGEEEAALPLTNAALPAARGGSCASSLSNAAGVQPRPVQLPLCVQPAATSSGGCLPAVEPASRLAAPVPHSSLLLAHRREQLERQVGGRERCWRLSNALQHVSRLIAAARTHLHAISVPWMQAAAAAQAPLPAEQLAAVRRAAATAATTLPLDARVFTGLPPQQQEEEESDGAGSGLSPSKRAALAAERKRLDARWVAEQRELQPPRGALWEALEARQQPGLAPLPPLAVPLPDGRQLAAAFLGLQGL